MSGKSDLVDVCCELRHETEKAFGVYEGEIDDKGKPVLIWLPKSQVERDGDIFTMPEWLAKDKGLI